MSLLTGRADISIDSAMVNGHQLADIVRQLGLTADVLDEKKSRSASVLNVMVRMQPFVLVCGLIGKAGERERERGGGGGGREGHQWE